MVIDLRVWLIRMLCGLLCLFLSLGTIRTARAQIGVTTYALAPVDTIRISQPVLSWRVIPNNGTAMGVRMTLNGKDIPAQYDAKKALATGTLPAPLAPGQYDVRCELILDNGRAYPKVWSFRVADKAPAKIPRIPATATDALATINKIRAKAGLGAIALDDRLCAAASLYCRETVHGNGNLTLADAVKAYAYPGQCYESVGSSFHPLSTMVQTLFDGPYHRSAFLQPVGCDVGVGIEGDPQRGYVLAILFSLGDESTVQTYPVDGQNGVPIDWDPRDDDNGPLKIHNVPGSVSRVGYPVTLYAIGPYGNRLTHVKATLTTESGVVVPCYLNTADNDGDNLDNGVVLIPKKPLMPGTTYRVSVSAENDQEETVTRLWGFTTARQNNPVSSTGKPRKQERTATKKSHSK